RQDARSVSAGLAPMDDRRVRPYIRPSPREVAATLSVLRKSGAAAIHGASTRFPGNLMIELPKDDTPAGLDPRVSCSSAWPCFVFSLSSRHWRPVPRVKRLGRTWITERQANSGPSPESEGRSAHENQCVDADDLRAPCGGSLQPLCPAGP